MTHWLLLPCPPEKFLAKLAEGYRFACEDAPGLPAPYVQEWNVNSGEWLVIMLKRDAA